MRSVLKILTCVLGFGAPGLSGHAIVPEAAPGQYQVIPERNVFGLRPPAAEPTLTNQSAPLPKITLTGITTILRNKRALMKVLPSGLKPGAAAKEESLILTEGQREGEIEVLQIDERAGSVKVNNSGTMMTLTFEKDGAKLPTTLGTPPAPTPLPGALAPNPYFPAAGARRVPARTFRSPGFGVAAAGAPGATAPPTGAVQTLTGLSAASGQAPNLADQQLSAEEQAIINAFQRQENETTPSYPPLPAVPPVPHGAQPTGAAPAGANLPGGTPAWVPQ